MKLSLDTLVELQDQYSDVYPLSPTGARGWIRAYRELPKLDPEVYIEWDKTHWRYHGEKDGWTYAHHFRPVEASDIPELAQPDKVNELVEAARRQVETERCPGCGELHTPLEDDFLNTLTVAHEAAAGSDGYLIVALTPRHENDVTVYQPEIYSRTLNTPAAKAIETQIVFLASQLLEEHALERISDHSEGMP